MATLSELKLQRLKKAKLLSDLLSTASVESLSCIQDKPYYGDIMKKTIDPLLRDCRMLWTEISQLDLQIAESELADEPGESLLSRLKGWFGSER